MNNLYERISIETEVLQATPHRQIQMLLDRCMQLILLSGHYMELNDVSNKCKSISKAMDIVAYLKLILKTGDEQTNKMSEALSHTYQYVDQQLLMANMKNDKKFLDDCLDKIQKVKASWDIIGENRE